MWASARSRVCIPLWRWDFSGYSLIAGLQIIKRNYVRNGRDCHSLDACSPWKRYRPTDLDGKEYSFDGMVAMLGGYTLAYFTMSYSLGVLDSSSSASKRRPKHHRQAHMSFLAGALDGKMNRYVLAICYADHSLGLALLGVGGIGTMGAAAELIETDWYLVFSFFWSSFLCLRLMWGSCVYFLTLCLVVNNLMFTVNTWINDKNLQHLISIRTLFNFLEYKMRDKRKKSRIK